MILRLPIVRWPLQHQRRFLQGVQPETQLVLRAKTSMVHFLRIFNGAGTYGEISRAHNINWHEWFKHAEMVRLENGEPPMYQDFF